MPSGGARKGAGRKPSPYKNRHEIRLSDDNLAWLRANYPRSMSNVINKLIDEKRGIYDKI